MIDLDLKRKFVENFGGIYKLNMFEELVPTNMIYLNNSDLQYLSDNLPDYIYRSDELVKLFRYFIENDINYISLTDNPQLTYLPVLYDYQNSDYQKKDIRLNSIIDIFRSKSKEVRKVTLCYQLKGDSKLERELLDIIMKYAYIVNTSYNCYRILIDYKHIYETLDEVTQFLLDNPTAPNYVQIVRRDLFKIATQLEKFDKKLDENINYFKYEQNKNKNK